MIPSLKSYIVDLGIILVIASLGFGGVWVWKLKKDYGRALETITHVSKERDEWKKAKETLQHTLDQIRRDEETAQSIRQESKVAEVQIKEVIRDRIVYVDRIVKEDPELNTRKLSPVLKGTIDSIQAARKERE